MHYLHASFYSSTPCLQGQTRYKHEVLTTFRWAGKGSDSYQAARELLNEDEFSPLTIHLLQTESSDREDGKAVAANQDFIHQLN